MATIADDLIAIKNEKARQRVAHNSDLIRKFVKEDLLLALRENIKAGHDGFAPVMAPNEIRPLFAAPLSAESKTNYNWAGSAYYKVFQEVETWANEQGLGLCVGHDMADHDRGGIPWANKDWGAYLTIREKPKPKEAVRPVPPQTQKITQGADFGVFGWVLLVLFIIGSCFAATLPH